MPCDYKTYPLNWFTKIRPAILERAGNCCEECGCPNYSLRYKFDSSSWTTGFSSYAAAKEQLEHSDIPDHFYIVVLTVVHLDHFHLNNHPSNLRALCLPCANQRDAKRRALIRKTKRQAYLDHLQPSLVFVTSTISIL